MLSIKDTEKMRKIIAENRVKCECGKKIAIPPFKDRMICRSCKHWVYRTPELEEKYKEEQKKKDFIKKMKGLIK